MNTPVPHHRSWRTRLATNRLSGSTSTYLRSAAHQPIDWHPWGAEAFELAKETGRPVLLDIGASWCHWCHVMDEGTYEDAEVARLIGQHFVAVKVDRDEHPEVDQRFQRQVSTLTGEGGWPLTAFVTADGEVFYGGTYFPPTDGHGRPGFRRVLKEMARIWSEEPERVQHGAATVREALGRLAQRHAGAAPPTGAFVEQVVADLRAGFDPAYGGWGAAPKFPHPAALSLLLCHEFHAKDPTSGTHARETLTAMADGGMYDQLGGGFHRYSVDERWRVPHFEKMGVDNAELLAAYTDGYRRFGDARFATVVRGIVRWSDDVLGDPGGGWGGSQDADNAPGDDGGYFTWTKPELQEALGADDARFAVRVFGVGTDARMPHDPDRSVLFRMLSPAEAVQSLHRSEAPELLLTGVEARLLATRARRPTPTVDTALYAAVNGRFVAGYCLAASALGEAAWVAPARTAADRWIASAVRPGKGIAHQLTASGARGYGLLEDQVSFARGLLELSVVTATARYLEVARELLEVVDREYRGEDGLLRAVAPALYDGPQIGGASEPSYPLEDNPHLGGNSAAALAFLRLGDLLQDDRWHERARALLAPVSSRLAHAGLFAGGAALAAGLSSTTPVRVVVEGAGTAADALVRAARTAYHPRSTVFAGAPPRRSASRRSSPPRSRRARRARPSASSGAARRRSPTPGRSARSCVGARRRPRSDRPEVGAVQQVRSGFAPGEEPTEEERPSAARPLPIEGLRASERVERGQHDKLSGRRRAPVAPKDLAVAGVAHADPRPALSVRGGGRRGEPEPRMQVAGDQGPRREDRRRRPAVAVEDADPIRQEPARRVHDHLPRKVADQADVVVSDHDLREDPGVEKRREEVEDNRPEPRGNADDRVLDVARDDQATDPERPGQAQRCLRQLRRRRARGAPRRLRRRAEAEVKVGEDHGVPSPGRHAERESGLVRHRADRTGHELRNGARDKTVRPPLSAPVPPERTNRLHLYSSGNWIQVGGNRSVATA